MSISPFSSFRKEFIKILVSCFCSLLAFYIVLVYPSYLTCLASSTVALVHVLPLFLSAPLVPFALKFTYHYHQTHA